MNPPEENKRPRKNAIRCKRTWRLRGEDNSQRLEFTLTWNGVMTAQDCQRLSTAVAACFDLAKGIRKVSDIPDSEPVS